LFPFFGYLLSLAESSEKYNSALKEISACRPNVINITSPRGFFGAVLHHAQDEGSQGTFATRSMQSSFASQVALNTENNFSCGGNLDDYTVQTRHNSISKFLP